MVFLWPAPHRPLVPGVSRPPPREVQLQLEMSDARQDLVAEGFDVAVRIGALEDSSLVARRLSAPVSAHCAPPRLPGEGRYARTPRDLERHNCLFYSPVSRRHPSGGCIGPKGERWPSPPGGNS